MYYLLCIIIIFSLGGYIYDFRKKTCFFYKTKTTYAKNFFQKKKFHFTFSKKKIPPLSHLRKFLKEFP